MNIRQHIRMTASEIAMGRYMRAPDHSAAGADFDTAFADFASPEGKPAEAAAGTEGAAASGGADDGGTGEAGAAATAGGSDGGDAGGGDGAAGTGTGGDGAAAGSEGAADAGATAGAGKDGAAGGDDAAAAAAAAAGSADAGAAPAGPDADAILDGLRKLVGEKAPEKAPEGAAAGGDAAGGAAQEQSVYTPEEQEFLTSYDKDWGDVAKGEALKRRAEYQQLLKHVFAQVAAFVKPIQETADVLAERTFVSDVKGAVPDYSDKLRGDVIEWTKSQPAYLQVAFNHVITEGTVDEVKDLVERYRQATGQAAPAPGGADAPAGKKTTGGNELSDEAKKAALALAPVDSKRSGVSAPSDPSNFEDAWKQAASDLG